ncbi:DMT family transporter [Aquabacterium sp. J223]|uniref:DMT family transporter n=1 Tax=Aquabacterium sp. J223 TaxID=2898431 RepID=UPI0021AD8C51|nr:DMT family transporter [Aquabacterium sp. J223]UUX94091.1 DMT family transporter [Aquabacterium sp. J223]
MPASLLMVLATFLFATMGVCVKLASTRYGTAEIVFYRGLIGAVFILVLARARGVGLRTAVPAMHAWRSVVGVSSLMLWFFAIGGLPLATAMTLNYMSSVWMALFLIGGAVLMGRGGIDGRLLGTVLAGFVGVALVLQPTLERDQLLHGVVGLVSGMLSALAYLQVTALGRAGEPELRIVFYFSLGGMLAGLLGMLATGAHGHSVEGALLLLAVGLTATTAQVLMTRAYAIGRPLINASLQYLGIVFSFVWGLVLFGDAATPSAAAGMALIVGAGLAATRLRQRAAPATRDPTADS